MGFDPLTLVPVVGDLISGATNARAARNAFKSRYQDTVRDIKKAGLNPALAYGQGGGSPQTHDIPNLGESFARGQQASASAKQARAQAEMINAQKEVLLAQKEDLIQEARLKNALTVSQTAAAGAQGGVSMAQQDLINQQIRGMQLDQNFQKATFEDRVAMVRRDLKRKGIDIGTAEIEQRLKRLTIPRHQAEARFFQTVGSGPQWLNSAQQVLQLLRGFNGL